MAEYIDREAVLNEIRKFLGECEESIADMNPTAKTYERGAFGAVCDTIDIIESIPTADVQEVRHGDWLAVTDYKMPLPPDYILKEKRYVCPYCRKAYRKRMNFCGNCGAKMRKGDA